MYTEFIPTKKFMLRALELACEAYNNGEVPVGAVVELNGKIIGEGRNYCEQLKDPTAHAEVIAIKNACNNLGDHRLNDCILYTTLEPCHMCTGAIINSKVKRVVFGAQDLVSGCCGGKIDLTKIDFLYKTKIYRGFMEEECSAILKDFFSKIRKEKVRGGFKMENLAQRLVKTIPSKRQLEWQKLEYTAFFHFGINTMYGKEWGDGNEDISVFNPELLDTDKWCKTIANNGIKACILTAKHHDGFCNWHTDYTEHSVKNTPYKKDILKQLSDSCKKYGLKLGVYLSPWDRHEKTYGTGKEYNDYFCNQLTELLTNYGEVYTVWFDGACGEGANGKKQVYDWERYYEIIRRLQPNAVISVCGPDVRWCGNEAGTCRKSEWSTVPEYMKDLEKIHENSQQVDDDEFVSRKTSSDEDLGSREVLKKAKEIIWYPSEVDTSIRKGWFYHEEQQPKDVSVLEDIYLKSVGGNSVLLLNIPPNSEGEIVDSDIKVLEELWNRVKKYSSNPIEVDCISTNYNTGKEENMTDFSDSFWSGIEGEESVELVLKLKETKDISSCVIMEQIEHSQRIEEFEVMAKVNEEWVSVYTATTVGYKKICIFDKSVYSDEFKVNIKRSRVCPVIKFIGFYS